MQGWTTPISF